VLRIFHLDAPTTLNSLQILSDQCNDEVLLGNLQELNACFNIDAEHTMSTLFSYLTNLTSLDITIDHTPDGRPWSLSATAFITIAQLKRLRALNLQYESQDDSESFLEQPTDEDDVLVDGRLSGSTASDDYLDTQLTSGAKCDAITERSCFGR
jgi:hypothetical protein